MPAWSLIYNTRNKYNFSKVNKIAWIDTRKKKLSGIGNNTLREHEILGDWRQGSNNKLILETGN